MVWVQVAEESHRLIDEITQEILCVIARGRDSWFAYPPVPRQQGNVRLAFANSSCLFTNDLEIAKAIIDAIFSEVE